MHAAVLHKLGTAPRYEPFPEPVAGDGEVIVHVHAASLKPIDKQLASGSHYASSRELPLICGSDGVGHRSDGQRVFFGGPRPPYGAMTQRTVVPRAFTFPVPEKVTDETAAALPNPAVSAWLSLAYRAKLAPGENVLILGATGVTGRLAVKIAKLLGAGRVVAAGRNQQVLSTLHRQGADATIGLDLPTPELHDAFVREAGQTGFQVVLDYVWGRPAEAFLTAMTRKEFAVLLRDAVCSGRRKRWADHVVVSRRASQHGTDYPWYCRNSTAKHSGGRLAKGFDRRRQRRTSSGHGMCATRGY